MTKALCARGKDERLGPLRRGENVEVPSSAAASSHPGPRCARALRHHCWSTMHLSVLRMVQVGLFLSRHRSQTPSCSWQATVLSTFALTSLCRPVMDRGNIALSNFQVRVYCPSTPRQTSIPFSDVIIRGPRDYIAPGSEALVCLRGFSPITTPCSVFDYGALPASFLPWPMLPLRKPVTSQSQQKAAWASWH